MRAVGEEEGRYSRGLLQACSCRPDSVVPSTNTGERSGAPSSSVDDGTVTSASWRVEIALRTAGAKFAMPMSDP